MRSILDDIEGIYSPIIGVLLMPIARSLVGLGTMLNILAKIATRLGRRLSEAADRMMVR